MKQIFNTNIYLGKLSPITDEEQSDVFVVMYFSPPIDDVPIIEQMGNPEYCDGRPDFPVANFFQEKEGEVLLKFQKVGNEKCLTYYSDKLTNYLQQLNLVRKVTYCKVVQIKFGKTNICRDNVVGIGK